MTHRLLRVERMPTLSAVSRLLSFGNHLSRSGVSKPSFLLWFASQSRYKYAWHLEEDVVLPNGTWAQVFSAGTPPQLDGHRERGPAQCAAGADLLAARDSPNAYSNAYWHGSGRQCHLDRNVPCFPRSHDQPTNRTGCVKCRVLWGALRMSRRLAQGLLLALESVAEGHHEALTGAFCASTLWCRSELLDQPAIDIGGHTRRESTTLESQLSKRGLSWPPMGWLFHPVKCSNVDANRADARTAVLKNSAARARASECKTVEVNGGGQTEDGVVRPRSPHPGSCPVQWRAGRAPLIVSLTTIPERLALLPELLDDLWNQTHPPDEVVVSLPRKWLHRAFHAANATHRTSGPGRLGVKHPRLAAAQAQGRLTVRWLEEDVGPLSRLLPLAAAAEHHAHKWLSERSAGSAWANHGPITSQQKRELSDATADMGVVVIDDDVRYTHDVLCQLVVNELDLKGAALGFRGFRFVGFRPNADTTLQHESTRRNLSAQRLATDVARTTRDLICETKSYRLPFGFERPTALLHSTTPTPHISHAKTAVDVLTQMGSMIVALASLKPAIQILQSVSMSMSRCSPDMLALLRFNDDLLVSAALSAVGVRQQLLAWQRYTWRSSKPHAEYSVPEQIELHLADSGCRSHFERTKDGFGLHTNENRLRRTAGAAALRILLGCSTPGCRIDMPRAPWSD